MTLLRSALLAALLPASLGSAAPPRHAVFRVTLGADSALTHGAPASGRLLIYMTAKRPTPGRPLAPALDPREVWIAAREVRDLRPGASISLDADSLAFPGGFSAAAPGRRWVMAVLDVDHNANWSPFTPGDLRSAVDSIETLGTRAHPLELRLSERVPEPPLPPMPGNTVVDIPSPRLSAFWKHPVAIRATVVAAPDSEAISTPAGPRFRAVYHIPGWGGTYRFGYTYGHRQVELMRQGGERGAVHVFLDPRSPNGHVVFANSANNGPWEDALIHEVLPSLESRFHLIPEARARYLTGHSSGGWASLWLQVNHPDVFGGAWASSPDPVDFADFVGPDVTPGSHDNFYRRSDGSARPFIRGDSGVVATLQEFTGQEEVLGPGGQMWSFEAVFGPRGANGRPAQAFDRATGRLNQAVLRAWAAYDIRRLLAARWSTLGPQLGGKLHVLVGGSDTFYLTGSTQRLCTFLASVHSDATCEVVPGRGHFDLQNPYTTYPHGLEYRFGEEMQRRFDSSRR